MKKRYPLSKLSLFLEHLESNMFSEDKRLNFNLEKSFPPKIDYDKMNKLCLEAGYIKEEKNKKNTTYYITSDGLKFLEEIRKIERDRKNLKFQEVLVKTNIVLALGIISQIVDGLYDVSFIKKLILWVLLLGVVGLIINIALTINNRD